MGSCGQLDYPLPPESIAQEPTAERDGSRLLIVDRQTRQLSHHRFHELPDLLPEQCTLFRNNARVRKSRLYARRPKGGAVECLLLRPGNTAGQWHCLLKPGRKLPPGQNFGIKGVFTSTVLDKQETGESLIELHIEDGHSLDWLCQHYGKLPLPPYIQRTETRDPSADDERYQTVYADPSKTVAAAAPTAGLHFTPQVLQALRERALPIYDLTLHIGLGTFKPIATENIADHPMFSEYYEIPAETCQALLDDDSRPRLAVGTTAVRAMEDFSRKRKGGSAQISERSNFCAEADLFLYPPTVIGSVDMLLTNFHLPRSTLLCLVAAFLSPGETDGLDWLKAIYQQAIERGYRFYSYGDAMLIL